MTAFRTPKLGSDLVTDVRVAMGFDTSADGNEVFTDANIIRVAQQKLEEDINPAIALVKEHQLTTKIDVPLISPASYDNVPSYPVPIESMAQLESVTFIDVSGRELDLTRDDEMEWVRRYYSSRTGIPQAYAFRGGRIHLHPHPTSVTNLFLRVRYTSAPMVLSADSTTLYRQIIIDPTVVGGDRLRFTMNATVANTSWMTSVNQEIDVNLMVLSGAPPHTPLEILSTKGVSEGFALAGSTTLDVPIPTVWPYTSGGIPTIARAGDFLVADFTSPIVQVPQEAYSTLRKGVCAELARAQGDMPTHDRLQRDYVDSLNKLPSKLTPRANNQPETYINLTSPGRLRRRGGRWGGRW